MAHKITIIDLFCGTGGFSHGVAKADPRFHVVYAIDSDSVASSTALANHPKAKVQTADIRKIQTAKVRELIGRKVDVIIGGPPCQGFSSLRPNRASESEDLRNSLYNDFARYVRELRPKVFVMENVVGLLTHNQGRTLERLLTAFGKLGYSVDWTILNAANFGVPQKRERFILIGAQDNGPIAFPTATHSFNGRVIGHRDKSRFAPVPKGLPKALSVMQAISDLPEIASGEQADSYIKRPKNRYQQQMRQASKALTLHFAADHSPKMLEIMRYAGNSIQCIPKHLVSSGFSSCYSRLAPDEPANTITVKFQSPASSKCIHPFQQRTITPREAARLQSFEDTFVFRGSGTQVAAQLGNAVPPILGTAIGRSISKMLR